MMTTAHRRAPRGFARGLLILVLLGVVGMLALYFVPMGGSGPGGAGSGSGTGATGGGNGTGRSYLGQLSGARDSGHDMHAQQTLRQIVQLAITYELSNDRYPTSADELYEGVAPMRDPWGEPYTVEFIAGASRRDVTVRISSPGRNGLAGDEDDLVAEQKLP
jgi:hypothetical protein